MPAGCLALAVVDDDTPVCTALVRLRRSAGIAARSYASASASPHEARLLAREVDIDIVFTGDQGSPMAKAPVSERGAVALLQEPLVHEDLLEAIALCVPRRRLQRVDWASALPPEGDPPP
jgi:FixJ family two-component response regulator